MTIQFTKQADADLIFFKMSGNKQVVEKIKQLLNAIVEDPFKGIGQPEPLKHELSGAWSRRIIREHRLIYEISDDVIHVLSLKGHY